MTCWILAETCPAAVRKASSSFNAPLRASAHSSDRNFTDIGSPLGNGRREYRRRTCAGLSGSGSGVCGSGLRLEEVRFVQMPHIGEEPDTAPVPLDLDRVHRCVVGQEEHLAMMQSQDRG